MHCKRLDEIHIPSTVMHIGDDAFCFCDSIMADCCGSVTT